MWPDSMGRMKTISNMRSISQIRSFNYLHLVTYISFQHRKHLKEVDLKGKETLPTSPPTGNR